MTTAEILNAAADLIEPEGAWTQGAMALDKSGRPASSPNGKDAQCFCGAGAIWRCAPRGSDYLNALAAFKAAQGEHLMSFNDLGGHTQADVVQALRDAAKAVS